LPFRGGVVDRNRQDNDARVTRQGLGKKCCSERDKIVRVESRFDPQPQVVNRTRGPNHGRLCFGLAAGTWAGHFRTLETGNALPPAPLLDQS